MRTTIISNIVWTMDHLETRTFNNGDEIPMANSIEEIVEYHDNGDPCCCYYDFDESNAHLGLLYNWFAAIDERGIAPEDFRIPLFEDVENTLNYLKNLDLEYGNTDLDENSVSRETLYEHTQMAPIPAGYLPLEDELDSIFQDKDHIAWYWTANYLIEKNYGVCFNFLGHDDGMFEPLENSSIIDFNYNFLNEPYGSMLSIRCVKDL